MVSGPGRDPLNRSPSSFQCHQSTYTSENHRQKFGRQAGNVRLSALLVSLRHWSKAPTALTAGLVTCSRFKDTLLHFNVCDSARLQTGIRASWVLYNQLYSPTHVAENKEQNESRLNIVTSCILFDNA